MARDDAKARFRAIAKLESRLEASMSEADEPGFAPNWFGSFDRVDLTNAVLRGYEALVELAPDDINLRYRFAGALARARRFDQARAIYSGLLDSMSAAQCMLAMVELASG